MTRPLTIDYDGMTDSEDVTFTANIRQFNNTSIHKPFQAAVIEDILSNGALSLKVFANGINSQSEGYVSVFVESNNWYYFCLLCFVGVIDASGEKRFLRSFLFPFEFPNQGCLIEHYIKRETLLEEHLELLPDDCLTLYVTVNIEIGFNPLSRSLFFEYSYYKEKRDHSFKTGVIFEEGKHFLSLDTKLFEKLKDASSYFQKMSETSMIERSTRLMLIPEEEYMTFRKVCCILLGSPSIPVLSIEELCSIYITSEKYLLSDVTENCIEMFISLLRADDESIKTKLCGNLQPIYQLAETYNDDLLIRVVESLSSRKILRSRKTEISDNIDPISSFNTEWHVYFHKDRFKSYHKDRFGVYFLNRSYYFTKRFVKHEDIEYNFYQ